MRLIEHIISTIAPHECLGCAREGSLLCVDCARSLPAIVSRCYRCQRLTDDFRTCRSCRSSSPLFAVYAATPYDGLAKDILVKIKYERAQEGMSRLAASVESLLPPLDDVIITHVPTAHARVRMRGFDQAQLLARQIAAIRKATYTPLLLRMSNKRQVGRRREERKKQMAEAFVATNLGKLQNKHILLVDDVITTGSTLEAAAATLKTAGVSRVSAVVFAAA